MRACDLPYLCGARRDRLLVDVCERKARATGHIPRAESILYGG